MIAASSPNGHNARDMTGETEACRAGTNGWVQLGQAVEELTLMPVAGSCAVSSSLKCTESPYSRAIGRTSP